MTLKWISLLSALGCALCPWGAASALPRGVEAADIDRLAARIEAQFHVPGMAVAIVKDDRVVFAKGYGVRELGKPAAVDPATLFGIGSNTKAFTVAALAMLATRASSRGTTGSSTAFPASALPTPTSRASLRCATCSLTAAGSAWARAI